MRKSVVYLTLADIAMSSVWEFALDEEGVHGQDETTVKPYPVNGPLDPAYRMFVACARLALADGTMMSDYFTPTVQRPAGLSTFPPVIIAPAGQVVFCCGMMVPDAPMIAQSYARLERAGSSEVFPLRFESALPLKSGGIKDEIAGFLVLTNFKTMRTRVVQ